MISPIQSVADVMTVAPQTVSPDTSAGELLWRFMLHDFNAFPVVDVEGTLRGIVTKLDLLRLLSVDEHEGLRDLREVSSRAVASLMGPDTMAVEVDDSVAAAARLMVRTGLRSLPVVRRRESGSMLIGIVSRGDLLRGLNRELLAAARAPARGEPSVP